MTPLFYLGFRVVVKGDTRGLDYSKVLMTSDASLQTGYIANNILFLLVVNRLKYRNSKPDT